MRKFTYLEIIGMYKKKGYTLNELIMGMNIFGVRNSDPISNTFDDAVGLLWKDTSGNWQLRQYAATTDPGLYYRENPANLDGTAIIIPGYYKDVYKIGLHTGYPAMEQIAPISYVRDNNKDGVLNWLYKIPGFKTFKQIGKTNIHHAGANSKQVDKWSAGCQVLAIEVEFNEFLNFIKQSNLYGYPNLFSYTLFEIEDFEPVILS